MNLKYLLAQQFRRKTQTRSVGQNSEPRPTFVPCQLPIVEHTVLIREVSNTNQKPRVTRSTNRIRPPREKIAVQLEKRFSMRLSNDFVFFFCSFVFFAITFYHRSFYSKHSKSSSVKIHMADVQRRINYDKPSVRSTLVSIFSLRLNARKLRNSDSSSWNECSNLSDRMTPLHQLFRNSNLNRANSLTRL